ARGVLAVDRRREADLRRCLARRLDRRNEVETIARPDRLVEFRALNLDEHGAQHRLARLVERELEQKPGELRRGFDDERARQHRKARKVIVEDLVAERHALDAARRMSGGELGDAIEQVVAHQTDRMRPARSRQAPGVPRSASAWLKPRHAVQQSWQPRAGLAAAIRAWIAARGSWRILPDGRSIFSMQCATLPTWSMLNPCCPARQSGIRDPPT